MVKYLAAATVLKVFSLNSSTRKIYRKAGNALGQGKRKRQDLMPYIERGDFLITLLNKYGLLHTGARYLEIGTGWLHWFGIYPRLHSEVSVDLFDVWDNRQFDALKHLFANLGAIWKEQGRLNGSQNDVLEAISKSVDYAELYRRLGLSYKIDEKGSLTGYKNDQYDCVYSFHVLEHIGRDYIGDTISNIYRVLKPGGYAIHQIGIDDHLAHYDSGVSMKNYLRYSRKTWKRFFENSVQYHNTLQPDDYMRMFKSRQFEIIEVAREKCDISGLPVTDDWKKYSQEDLETTILTIIFRKPK